MKLKLLKKPPNWTRLARRKTQEIKGEILEMALGFFLCSDWVTYAIEHVQGALVHTLLRGLQSNNNVLGILRVLLPVLLFAAFCFTRRLATHLAKRCVQAYQCMRECFEEKRKQRSQPEDEV